MKLLVLDEYLSWPIDSGKKVRTYNILHQLAAKHDITLLTYVWGDKNEATGLEHFQSLGINVVTVFRHDPKKSGPYFYWKLGTNLFSSLPYIVDGHISKSYSDRVRALVAEREPDAVMAEWSPYSIFLKDIEGVPRVAVAHNLEASIWQGYVEKAADPLRRAYLKYQYRKVAAFEDSIFRWIDGLVLVSPIEFQTIKNKFPDLKSALVENGVDVGYFSPHGDEEEENMISFCGAMDWRPNQDAVEYFITNILPILRNFVSDLRVLIIGREPPQWLVSMGSEAGVEFTGSVDDVRPYVRRSAVSMVPLRIGGGSRLKILEALSMGKAVVSTSLGAEGLEVTNNQHLVIADEAAAFAEAVNALLLDRERRQSMGEAGRQLVCSRYRWEEIAKVQSQFLESLVQLADE